MTSSAIDRNTYMDNALYQACDCDGRFADYFLKG